MTTGRIAYTHTISSHLFNPVTTAETVGTSEAQYVRELAHRESERRDARVVVVGRCSDEGQLADVLAALGLGA